MKQEHSIKDAVNYLKEFYGKEFEIAKEQFELKKLAQKRASDVATKRGLMARKKELEEKVKEQQEHIKYLSRELRANSEMNTKMEKIAILYRESAYDLLACLWLLIEHKDNVLPEALFDELVYSAIQAHKLDETMRGFRLISDFHVPQLNELSDKHIWLWSLVRTLRPNHIRRFVREKEL